jgi:NTP pyrophosphatase (non-canonical NTP hydrolase)
VDFQEYQLSARETDQFPETDLKSVVIPLLGLAGEAGSLLTEYKKYFRDGDSYKLFPVRLEEELGDILWYVSAIAGKAGLSLDSIAATNLAKIRERWKHPKDADGGGPKLLDEAYPAKEQLPRQCRITLREIEDKGKRKAIMEMDGNVLGDYLTDNAHEDDKYRFHDVFHLAYAAVLGWSPVFRWALKRKRKSDPVVDEVEDGARGIVLEEGISAVIFEHARGRSFYDGVASVDYDLLRTVKGITSHVEVHVRSLRDWEKAILDGFCVWRQVRDNKGGTVRLDLTKQLIEFER